EKVASGLGVRFVYDTTIKSIDVAGGRVTHVTTDKGIFTADKFVTALGSFSPLLLRPLGIDIPVYPVKGYSITVPIADEASSPQSTVMDET
ncbi:FAD-dependent oxidoreductase, partial [Enterococcus faecium]|uniref:FAD-dependent oxidoreductase n=1 Tax=Enterococcus faecium TaxID=1352 RepID=UPI003F5270A9